jgi:teichuronic acid biosynthesis glycosyltransferase TuaC
VKIVSVSSVYPKPGEPGLGLFVRSRLLHMAELAEVVVVAPVPAIDYSHPRRKLFGGWRGPARRFDSEVEVLHPRWFYPPGGTPLNVLCLFMRLFWTLAALRKRFRFELIDSHFGYPEGVAAGLLAFVFRVPFTITMRGSEPGFARRRLCAICLRWAVRRASAIFTVSEELRRFAIAYGADPARVRVVPNGIDRAVFHPRERARRRAEFGIHPDRTAILSAGELIEAKGHHLVLEAVRELVSEGRAIDLFIAGGVARGGAPFADEIERRISEWNLGANVRLTGWLDREQLAELMCAADVFCLASFTEGWPNVVNEALACGTPVVATRVGAVPEMLPGDRYGVVVPPRDQPALTGALRHAALARWDRDAIAAWGSSRCWKDAAREVIDTMSVLAGQAPGTPGTLPQSRGAARATRSEV